MIIGIDLGTTNSVVSIMDQGGPQLIPNALGDVLTPSVVGVDVDGEMLVGRAAKELQVIHPDRCAALFKRQMGSEWSTSLDGKKFSPEDLSALVVRSLKQDAEAYLGQSIERAVITVPAYFNDNQRTATLRAGQAAGLKVERILNEPTAAAIAYGLHEANEEKVVVVFDLGGGTFDISVVELFEGTVEVRASSGECFLGGEDFTRLLAARVMQQQGEVFERAEMDFPKMVSRMIHQCELAKLALSRSEQTEVRAVDRDGGMPDDAPSVTVTREQFEQWIEHILARIELPIRRGLGDAGLKRSEIDEVILVGGATRMPAVVRRVTELFGKSPRCRIDPDEVVAMGAAVQAGLIDRNEQLDDLVVTDVAPFTLGYEVARRVGLEHRSGYFSPVIDRNTTIPVSRVQRVQTVLANQTTIGVGVYQGESRMVKDNLLLGEFDVSGIPRGPAGQDVDIRFTYDLNGVLEVEATVVETGRKAGMVITRHAKGLSEKEIARAVEVMQAIKTHPREETANRFLIKRAERVYRELPMLQRQILGEAIEGFETAMEMQEKDLVQRHHEALSELLDQLESGWSDDETGEEDEYRN
jgi:molecular chaperone HscC